MKDLIKNISNNFIRLREKSGISQSELSRRTGVKSATISTVESCWTLPSLLTCFKISSYFGISIDDLCRLEEIEVSDHNVFHSQFGEFMLLSKKDKELVSNLIKRLSKNV